LGSVFASLDTAVFIYFIEEHPQLLAQILPLFEEADRGHRALVTSALTLLEVLVVPYRAGDLPLAERYEALLTKSRGIHVTEITRDELRTAAHLRAITGISTPDALQLASAIGANCRTFITNDRRLPQIPGRAGSAVVGLHQRSAVFRRELLTSRFPRTSSFAAVGARGRGLLRASVPAEQGAQSDQADFRCGVAAIRDPSDAQTGAQGSRRRRQSLQGREMCLKR